MKKIALLSTLVIAMVLPSLAQAKTVKEITIQCYIPHANVDGIMETIRVSGSHTNARQEDIDLCDIRDGRVFGNCWAANMNMNYNIGRGFYTVIDDRLPNFERFNYGCYGWVTDVEVKD